jgi:hypothetical protein
MVVFQTNNDIMYTLVYKHAPAGNVSNYRPISLTCDARKIMETVVVCQMLHYPHEHRLISREQHGFLAGRSTDLNSVDAQNDMTPAINNRRSIAAAYVDYAKAFDSVSPLKLYHRLKVQGIAGNLLL